MYELRAELKHLTRKSLESVFMVNNHKLFAECEKTTQVKDRLKMLAAEIDFNIDKNIPEALELKKELVGRVLALAKFLDTKTMLDGESDTKIVTSYGNYTFFIGGVLVGLLIGLGVLL